MYIYELPISSPITITVKLKGSNQLEWKRTVLKTSIKQKHILVPVLTAKGKVLSFNVPGIQIEITAASDDGPAIFRNCTIRTLVVGGVKYHEIICRTEAYKENRRENDRITLDYDCYIDSKNFQAEGVIRDVSIKGFSVLINADCEPDVKNQVENIICNFRDPLLKRDITFKGKIIRRVKQQANMVLYGCHMEPNLDAAKIVSIRESLK